MRGGGSGDRIEPGAVPSSDKRKTEGRMFGLAVRAGRTAPAPYLTDPFGNDVVGGGPRGVGLQVLW